MGKTKEIVALMLFFLCTLVCINIVYANQKTTVAHSDPIAPVLLGLTAILLAAKIGGELFEKVGQPSVLGELVFGMILGNLALITSGMISFDSILSQESIDIMSRLGVMILLFEVGLESNIKDLAKVGPTSLIVAMIGIAAPMLLGYFAGAYLIPDAGFNTHLFLGATLTATSVGITARVLKDLNKLSTKEAKVIMGAAVIDDILGLIILSVVSDIIITGAVDIASIASISATSIMFLAGSIVIGLKLAPVIGKLVSSMKVEGMKIVTAFLFMFIMAFLADSIGLATIVGAFGAGLILDDVTFRNKKEHHIEDLVKPLYNIFVPIFFVLMGIQVNLQVFRDPQVMLLAIIITIIAVIGKQASGLGAFGHGINKRIVGIGMISRGEVGLIFAGVGRELGVISDSLFGSIVIMVILTTFLTPPLLKWSLKQKYRDQTKDLKPLSRTGYGIKGFRPQPSSI